MRHDKRDEFHPKSVSDARPAYEFADSILRDLELLEQMDKKMFLNVAFEVRVRSRKIEDTMLGEDHPHARFFDAHRNDPFLDEIKAMELSENVSG